MRKIGRLVVLVFMVGMAYVLLVLLQPATNTLIESANSSINWTAHPSFGYAQAVMVGWPFWVYLIPACTGTIVGVAILKGE